MKKCKQRNSGIGGQAVLEGVMMRNGENYAIAVRKSDGSIVLKKEKYRGILADSPLKKIPFLRGVFVFIDSMILGLRCTDYSASIYAEDDPEDEKAGAENADVTVSETGVEEEAAGMPKDEAEKEVFISAEAEKEKISVESSEAETEKKDVKAEDSGREKESLGERIMMGAVMVVSLILALGLFMVLPYFLASYVVQWIGNTAVLSLLEGVLRIGIFVCYILAISQMKDIRRLFQFHGAEHKCINCLESGRKLTVENASQATRLHKRCGSSFILFVMMVSIVLFFFIRVRNPLARVGLRILLLPVISGISYELIRFAGSSDNPVIGLLSKPGLWLQGLTTKEPDAEMLEVAIASVEAVFDWQDYLDREFGPGAGTGEEACAN